MDKFVIFEKAKRVIQSCRTKDQLDVAKRYVEAAKKQIRLIVRKEHGDDIFHYWDRCRINKAFSDVFAGLLKWQGKNVT